jgi:hypothetical protein
MIDKLSSWFKFNLYTEYYHWILSRWDLCCNMRPRLGAHKSRVLEETTSHLVKAISIANKDSVVYQVLGLSDN